MTIISGKQPQGKFIFKKQNKIRWKRSPISGDHELLQSGSLFVSGSWDDFENEVTLWKWTNETPMDDETSRFGESTGLFEPQLLASFDHRFGDVNEIQFLTSDVVATASSDGSVTLLRIDRDSLTNNSTGYKFVQVNKWNKIHSSCNGLSVNGDSIVSVGSDGKIFLLNGRRPAPLRTYANADSGSICCPLFLKQDQVASANSRGQVKIWDLRSSEEVPTKTCHLAMDLVGITSMAKHPTQPHVIVGGGANGVLAFWDLRGNQDYPLSVVKAHTDAVSEVHFHEQQPDHMFSCSQSGDVWHWNGSNVAKNSSTTSGVFNTSSVQNIWLNSELVKNRVDTKPLMAKQALPVNSMSIHGSSVLVAGDSEAIFVIPDVGL